MLCWARKSNSYLLYILEKKWDYFLFFNLTVKKSKGVTYKKKLYDWRVTTVAEELEQKVFITTLLNSVFPRSPPILRFYAPNFDPTRLWGGGGAIPTDKKSEWRQGAASPPLPYPQCCTALALFLPPVGKIRCAVLCFHSGWPILPPLWIRFPLSRAGRGKKEEGEREGSSTIFVLYLYIFLVLTVIWWIKKVLSKEIVSF